MNTAPLPVDPALLPSDRRSKDRRKAVIHTYILHLLKEDRRSLPRRKNNERRKTPAYDFYKLPTAGKKNIYSDFPKTLTVVEYEGIVEVFIGRSKVLSICNSTAKLIRPKKECLKLRNVGASDTLSLLKHIFSRNILRRGLPQK